jgi:transposase
VRRVQKLKESGMSVRKIAEEVSSRRLPVSKSSVQRILAGGDAGSKTGRRGGVLTLDRAGD